MDANATREQQERIAHLEWQVKYLESNMIDLGGEVRELRIAQAQMMAKPASTYWEEHSWRKEWHFYYNMEEGMGLYGARDLLGEVLGGIIAAHPVHKCTPVRATWIERLTLEYGAIRLDTIQTEK